MKSSISVFGFSLLLIFSFESFAQGEAGLPFLSFSPSPESNGLGLTGVSFPSDDPLGFYYNPANLGQFGQNNNLAIQSYPGSTHWLNYDQLKYNNYGINFGYNLKNQLNGLNVSIGAGFIHSKFNYYSFDNYDSFNAYGFGASINYFLTLSLGITYKNIRSNFKGYSMDNQIEEYTTKANAFDYGVLLTVPVLKLIAGNYSFNFPSGDKLYPEFNYNIGYSRSNIGDEVSFIDPAQKDPLPLTARLGHTFDLGFNFKTDAISINLINYKLILEVDDILISRNDDGISYQGLLGDINIGKNLFLLKADNKVLVHKANEISFIETVSILQGSYNGRGYPNVMKNDGLVFSTKGIFKFLSAQLENETIKFITNHLEIKYSTASIFQSIGIPFYLSGISINLSNFYL